MVERSLRVLDRWVQPAFLSLALIRNSRSGPTTTKLSASYSHKFIAITLIMATTKDSTSSPFFGRSDFRKSCDEKEWDDHLATMSRANVLAELKAEEAIKMMTLFKQSCDPGDVIRMPRSDTKQRVIEVAEGDAAHYVFWNDESKDQTGIWSTSFDHISNRTHLTQPLALPEGVLPS